MNVTHLDRLVNSLDNCWFKKFKKEKKNRPGRCWHWEYTTISILNLNLEASARQGPNAHLIFHKSLNTPHITLTRVCVRVCVHTLMGIYTRV